MDPEGNIYPIDPDEAEKQPEILQRFIAEDMARFDGYMRAQSENPEARKARQAEAWEKRLKELEARAKARSKGSA